MPSPPKQSAPIPTIHNTISLNDHTIHKPTPTDNTSSCSPTTPETFSRNQSSTQRLVRARKQASKQASSREANVVTLFDDRSGLFVKGKDSVVAAGGASCG